MNTEYLTIKNETTRKAFTGHCQQEHRFEFVKNINGIEFINDSASTNVAVTWCALESIDKPVIWIAGGINRAEDYSLILPLVLEKVRIIVCIGAEILHMHETFGTSADMMITCQTLQEALHVAYRMAKAGEVVLFSPAHASFDMFKNYEDRGWQFKKGVNKL